MELNLWMERIRKDQRFAEIYVHTCKVCGRREKLTSVQFRGHSALGPYRHFVLATHEIVAQVFSAPYVPWPLLPPSLHGDHCSKHGLQYHCLCCLSSLLTGVLRQFRKFNRSILVRSWTERAPKQQRQSTENQPIQSSWSHTTTQEFSRVSSGTS